MRTGYGLKRISVLLLLVLFAYLSVYTWNLRTGYLDRFADRTALELTNWLLWPGRVVHERATTMWDNYVNLMDVQRENRELHATVNRLLLEVGELREEAIQARRLERMLDFAPPEGWSMQGARVTAHRLGPASALETFMVDKGLTSGTDLDTPVVTPRGVVGRVLRVSHHAATVLLVTDPNSSVSVLSQDTRTSGILTGQGPGEPLSLRYVPLNDPLEEGELLVTSGLAGIFPKGFPVGRITSIERSDISLFKTVSVELLVDVRNLEEVLVLVRRPAGEISFPPPAGADLSGAEGTGNAAGNASGEDG